MSGRSHQRTADLRGKVPKPTEWMTGGAQKWGQGAGGGGSAGLSARQGLRQSGASHESMM